jgi:hypothetical protein
MSILNYFLEVKMTDVIDNDKPVEVKEVPPVKPVPPKAKPPKPFSGELEDATVVQRHKVGLVEIVMILLLAGVVFIFIFGMSQMKREKAEELALQKKIESTLPMFDMITKAAKALKNDPNWGAWPFDITQLNMPSSPDTPDFKFTIDETGVITCTCAKSIGKEGVKILYNIDKNSYDVQDPNPDAKPKIRQDWLTQ